MLNIGVFPASGKLGSSICRHLAKSIDAKQLVFVSRKPEAVVQRLSLPDEIATRKADYDTPETLRRSFEGITYLVLISYPSLEIEPRVQAHKQAIDSAVASGVSHIFYTSLAFGGDCKATSKAHVMQAHLQTESYLRSLAASNSHFSFTSIREGIYSESYPMYIGFPSLSLEGLEFNNSKAVRARIPHDGSGPGIAWAKIDELGEAIARLVELYAGQEQTSTAVSDEYKNRVILLSGPRVYSLIETIGHVAVISRTKLTLEPVSKENFVNIPSVQSNLGSHGRDDVPRKWTTTFDAVSKGETAVASDRLERLLGRKPESFEETMAHLMGSTQ